MQKALTCRHVGAPTARTVGPEGVLEDPYGVKVLQIFGQAICSCSRALSTLQESEVGNHQFSWLLWDLGDVNFSHAKALLYMHGATLQQLFSPYVLVHALPRPAYHLLPGADQVRVAIVDEQTTQLIPPLELFKVLSLTQ